MRRTRCETIQEGAWLLTDVLTEDECQWLQEQCIERGMVDYRADSRLRVMERIELDMPELAERIFERIAPLLPRWVLVDGSEETKRLGLPWEEPLLHGCWQLSGLNPFMRVARYPGGGVGHFGPHRDGHYEKSLNERSLVTLNGYLNSVPDGCGGATRFLEDGLEMFQDAQGRFTVKDPASSVRHAVQPQTGAAVAFYHGQMHDGEPLSEDAPPKWIFRFDVMYRRDGVLIDETSESARRMEVEAEAIEREMPMVSMELYRLAERLRAGRESLSSAQARAAALLGREALLSGVVDTDTWKAPEEASARDQGGASRDTSSDTRQGEIKGGLEDARPSSASMHVRLSLRATGASSVHAMVRAMPGRPGL